MKPARISTCGCGCRRGTPGDSVSEPVSAWLTHYRHFRLLRAVGTGGAKTPWLMRDSRKQGGQTVGAEGGQGRGQLPRKVERLTTQHRRSNPLRCALSASTVTPSFKHSRAQQTARGNYTDSVIYYTYCPRRTPMNLSFLSSKTEALTISEHRRASYMNRARECPVHSKCEILQFRFTHLVYYSQVILIIKKEKKTTTSSSNDLSTCKESECVEEKLLGINR